MALLHCSKQAFTLVTLRLRVKWRCYANCVGSCAALVQPSLQSVYACEMTNPPIRPGVARPRDYPGIRAAQAGAGKTRLCSCLVSFWRATRAGGLGCGIPGLRFSREGMNALSSTLSSSFVRAQQLPLQNTLRSDSLVGQCPRAPTL
jgi:hypothetical protein